MPMYSDLTAGQCTMAEAANLRIRFLWGLLLLSAVLLSSSCTAAFNSNYILEPVYTRDWSSGLVGLENFIFILAFDDPLLNSPKDGFSGTACYKVFEVAFSPDPRDSCSFVHEYIAMKKRELATIPYNEY